MTTGVDEFLSSVPGLDELRDDELVDFFVYFWTVTLGHDSATGQNIRDCFQAAHMRPHAHIPQYLSRRTTAARGQRPTFVKKRVGYVLERNRRSEIAALLGAPVVVPKSASNLARLSEKLLSPNERKFLEEAIRCFEVGAYRAAVILAWMLTIDHLYEFVLSNELTAFNSAISKVTDKRVRVTSVKRKDDFSDIPDGIFISVCRSGGIISNDVRKILETKLGIRNSSAHPSEITISRLKAEEFIDDLVSNVVLKYAV